MWNLQHRRAAKRMADTIARFTLRRVIVTTRDDRDARGVFREVLADGAIVLTEAEWLTQEPGDNVIAQGADGALVIPAANVSSLQVLPADG